jgi:hypothetical protein
VPITKPGQRHKYDTKTVQMQENKTLNSKNKDNMGGKKQYTKEVLEQKTLYPEKQIS